MTHVQKWPSIPPAIQARREEFLSKHEQKVIEPLHWTQGSELQFVVDLEQGVCHVSVDGRKYEAVFRDLPAVIYPAVSNCGASGTYRISF